MRRIALMLAGTLALAACGGDSTAPAKSAWVGTWALVSVNGKALPATVTTCIYTACATSRYVSGTLRVISDSLAFWDDSTESDVRGVPWSQHSVYELLILGDQLNALPPLGSASDVRIFTRTSPTMLYEQADDGTEFIYRHQ